METSRGRIAVVAMRKGRRNPAAIVGKAVWLAACVVIWVPGLCAGDPPAWEAPLLSQPAAPQQFINDLLLAPHIPGPTTNDDEIQELARGLRYDPNLIYKFVHDHIHFTPTWGEVKGPYMTWMDRSGNAFDQASLLIALLTNANGHGHTITDIKYVVSRITLEAPQFSGWFASFSRVTETKEMLARGGLYAEVDSNDTYNIDDVHLVHVWVKATVDGKVCRLDPSFKNHTYSYPTDFLPNFSLSSAMDYNQPEFLEGAGPNGGRWGKSAIQADLTTYTTNLIDYVKDNYQYGADDIRRILNSKSIDPLEDPTPLPTRLPYFVDSNDDEFAIDSIPDICRTSLRVEYAGINEKLYSSDIYGRRLSLTYNSTSQKPELKLDDALKAQGDPITPGQMYNLTLTVDHPCEKPDGTPSLDAAATLQVKAGGFYHIVNGWGDTGIKILLKYRGLLEQHLGQSGLNELVRDESYAIVALTWLAKMSYVRDLAGRMDGCTLVNQHLLGITGRYDAPYIDVPLGHLGVGRYRMSPGAYTEPLLFTIAGFASAYQQEMIRQLQGCDTISTPLLLEMANDDQANAVLTATTTQEWNTIRDTQLTGWTSEDVLKVQDYVNNGYVVSLPKNGSMTQSGWNWTGTGFRATRLNGSSVSAAYVLGGASGFKGGTECVTTDLDSDTLFDNALGAASDGDPEGAYSTGSMDIALGTGGFPFGLAFGRQYSSHRRLKDGPLGLGWTHNYDITAKVLSDSFQVWGSESTTDAAAQIVSLYVTKWNIYRSTPDWNLQTTANLCETWLMDRMKDNVVEIRQGASTMRFIQMPDDSYHAPGGQALRLLKRADNSYQLKNSKGIFYDFDVGGRLHTWTDAHGNTVHFTYGANGLSLVQCVLYNSTPSWSLSFDYNTSGRVATVNDSAGRHVSYTYTSNGELATYTHPDGPGHGVTYAYKSGSKGRLMEISSPLNRLLTIEYDDLGRMKQQTDAENQVWDFYRATYRNEVVPPTQTDANGVTGRFSSSTWANPDTRQVVSKDPVGRKTTGVYDAQARLESVTSAAGMSVDFAYDENSNVLSADSWPIPGSTDPNLLTKHGYCTYGNPDVLDERWFIHQKELTDPREQKTLYYYDYDHPEIYSTQRGLLMKVISPAVDPEGDPPDTRQPTVEYTYNVYGQVETQTDPTGLVTRFVSDDAADGASLKKTIVDAGDSPHLNLTTEVTRDAVGRVLTTTDPRGNITTNEYFDSGLLKKITPPAPFNGSEYQTSYVYDYAGRLQSVAQGSVVLQYITYNNRGQKLTTRGPYPVSQSYEQCVVNRTTCEYDNLGRVWKVTDAEGHVTTALYWADGKVGKVIDAEGHESVFNVYDPNNGSLLKVTDAKGNVTRYEYNNFMALKKATYEGGTNKQFGYDPYRRLVMAYDRGGQEFWTEYDNLGRVDKKIVNKPGGATVSTTEYVYDLAGRLYTTTKTGESGGNGTTTNTYDTAGRLSGVQYPDGKTVSYEYDECGNRTQLDYPDGVTHIAYEYDELNRLMRVLNGQTALATYTYDTRSRRTGLTYGNTATIAYEYDVASRLQFIDNQTANGQHKYSYTYDNVGNRTSMMVSDNGGTRAHMYSYDSIYQVTGVDYPAGFEYLAADTRFDYDAAGNRSRVLGGGPTPVTLNQEIALGAFGAVVYTPDSGYTGADSFSWNGSDGNAYAAGAAQVSLTVGLSGENLARGRPVVASSSYTGYPASNATDGDPTTRWSSQFSDSQWIYVDLGSSCTINRVVLRWEAAYGRGYKLQVSDNASTWSDVYTTTTGNGGVDDINLSAPATGRYVRMLGTQRATQWGYSLWEFEVYRDLGLHEPATSLALNQTVTASSSYTGCPAAQAVDGDRESRWSSQFSDNEWLYVDLGASRTIGRVVLNWEAAYGHHYKLQVSGDATTWSDVYSTLDGHGGVEDIVLETPATGRYVRMLGLRRATQYGYSLYELKVYGPGSPNQAPTVSNISRSTATNTLSALAATELRGAFTDPDAGDYLQKIRITALPSHGVLTAAGTCSYTSNELNQYTAAGGVSFTYDPNGNLTSDGTNRYSYDLENRLIRVRRADTQQELSSNVYDAFGRRVEKWLNGVTPVKYVYDGDHCIAEYNGSGQLLRKYIYGPGTDEPICLIESTGSYAGTYYYHFDGLGSVTALTNSSGNTVEVYEYDVYGRVGATDASHPNRFMFTGREYDKETGLYYYRARYYNPQIGRFLQTDPIGYGDGMNIYTYCRNNPSNAVDPLGTAGMMTRATGKAAVSQGPEDMPLIWGAIVVVDWRAIMKAAFDKWGEALKADAKAYLYDVVTEVAIESLPNLIGKAAGKVVSAALGAAIDAAGTIHAQWRAFIEVEDACDIDNDGKITSADVKCGKRWVELFGVYPIGSPADGGGNGHWTDGGGYGSAEEAFGACQNAIIRLMNWQADPYKAFKGFWDSPLGRHDTPFKDVSVGVSKLLTLADWTAQFTSGIQQLEVRVDTK